MTSQCSIAIDRKRWGPIAHVVCRSEVGYVLKSSVLDWSTIIGEKMSPRHLLCGQGNCRSRHEPSVKFIVART